MKLLWAAFAEIGQFDHPISAQDAATACQKRLKTSFVRHLTRFGGITCGQTCRFSHPVIFISGLLGEDIRVCLLGSNAGTRLVISLSGGPIRVNTVLCWR